jgi:hypothetical protein
MSTTVSPTARFPTFARLRPAARWLVLCFALLLALVVVYALSFGPAVMMAQRRLVRTETVEKVYSPLETATLIVPGAHWLLRRYVGLWATEDPQL